MRTRPVIILLLLLFAVALAVQPASAKQTTVDPFANEPFETFRTIDRTLASLDSQFAALKKAADPEEKAAKRAWVHAARQMQITTRRLEIRSLRMAHYYRRHGRKLGYKLFSELYGKTRILNRDLTLLERSQTRKSASLATARVEKAMLNMVLQFQAVSGGYGAAHCEPGQWICGEPKTELKKAGYPKEGTKWNCVQHARQCTGLLGPQTPLLKPDVIGATAKK